MSGIRAGLMNPVLKETVICKFCLEPVTNYICSECMFDNVLSWLEQMGRYDLVVPMFRLHEKIKQMIQNDENSASCSVCKKDKGDFACPCCYLCEVYVSFRDVSAELGERFVKDFNFNFHHDHSSKFSKSLKGILTKNFQPVVIVDKRKSYDMNICENCEQNSDDIAEQNGMWLCESCRELE